MKYKTKFSEDWKSWIQVNLERGVEKTYVFNTLIENGFSYQAVAEEMDFEPKLRQSLPIEWREWLDENISKNESLKPDTKFVERVGRTTKRDRRQTDRLMGRD